MRCPGCDNRIHCRLCDGGDDPVKVAEAAGFHRGVSECATEFEHRLKTEFVQKPWSQVAAQMVAELGREEALRLVRSAPGLGEPWP